MKRLLLISTPLVLLFSGCTGFTGVAKALSKDNNTLILSASTPYGPQRLLRVGSNTNSVTIAPDGSVTINPKK